MTSNHKTLAKEGGGMSIPTPPHSIASKGCEPKKSRTIVGPRSLTQLLHLGPYCYPHCLTTYSKPPTLHRRHCPNRYGPGSSRRLETNGSSASWIRAGGRPPPARHSQKPLVGVTWACERNAAKVDVGGGGRPLKRQMQSTPSPIAIGERVGTG